MNFYKKNEVSAPNNSNYSPVSTLFHHALKYVLISKLQSKNGSKSPGMLSGTSPVVPLYLAAFAGLAVGNSLEMAFLIGFAVSLD